MACISARKQSKLSDRVLKEEPSCRLCPSPSAEMDHVVPTADGGGDERGNLQGLCEQCHKEKTRAENRARSARRNAKLAQLAQLALAA